MAHGLEIRVPILSNGMVEYAAHLPSSVRHRADARRNPCVQSRDGWRPRLHNRPPSGILLPADGWMRRDLVRTGVSGNSRSVWRGSGSFDELDGCGNMRSQAGMGTATPSGTLAGRLFDLMLLALWMERHRLHL